jgi:hypothetical protein
VGDDTVERSGYFGRRRFAMEIPKVQPTTTSEPPSTRGRDVSPSPEQRLTMRRTFAAMIAVMLMAVWSAQAGAVWVDSTVRYVRSGYHTNRHWPWPYYCPDREAVRQPFEAMVANGWRRQNLLGPHHFDSEKGTLTTAGELKVHWIMTQAPADRRSIFVERSLDSGVTAQHVEAAREYASRFADGRTPQVNDTHLISEGRPAALVDATYIRFNESMLPPVLPPPSPSSNIAQ